MLQRSECMIDLETMSTDTHAVIVSIGAVKWDKDGLGDVFYAVPDRDQQVAQMRHVSESTLDWWAKQAKEAKAVFEAPQDDVPDVLNKFANWLGPRCNVWGNGADFDITILGTLFEDFEEKKPWAYANVRCYRTLKNICNFPAGGIPAREGTYHNALDDAVHQANAAALYWKAGLK